jgi:oligopeptide/dipeptide ABC transporter ATP-binding protein
MSMLAQLEGLKVYFYDQKDKRFIRAVKDVGFQVRERTVVGLVGESGCGKTMTALSMMGLVDGEPGVIGGSFLFRPKQAHRRELEGELRRNRGNGCERDGMLDLFCGLDRFIGFEQNPFTVVKDMEKWFRRLNRTMEHIRGKNISMIFQNPVLSLSPFNTVGEQLTATIRRFSTVSWEEAWERGVDLLRTTLLYSPEEIMYLYPSQLSQGMAQRVVIAVALCSDPRLLIADEPTSGLDTTHRYKIIDLLESLTARLDLTLLLISHNIHIVGLIAHRVVVMYAGLVVETGGKREVIERKRGIKHPYTEALIASIPTDADIRRGKRLGVIFGTVPNNKLDIRGCPFMERCPYSRGKIRERCRGACPDLIEVSPGHFIRCYLYYP